MPSQEYIKKIINKTESYLAGTLLPFWIQRSPDPKYGGFLTYFDKDGNTTGETVKSFLMQIRMLFTMSSAHRAGYGEGKCAELAEMGAEFILHHYWDHGYGGWYWIADREGNPTYTGKVGYGQCFAMYAFSEYYLATGDKRGLDAAQKTFGAIAGNMADTFHGGYYELMKRNWQPERPGEYGGDRKSMDVHMHMMEALTTLYEVSQHPTHLRRLEESIDIVIKRMLHPEHLTGYMQFALDFTPLPAILFKTEWGRDADVKRPLDYTSYGHNVEFVWLLLHAADIMGENKGTYSEIVKKNCDHCEKYGIDHEYGGVYTEGPVDAPTSLTEKQFWQQGEVLIGMLDAYRMFGDEKYWDAFENVYKFLFDKFVDMKAGGEWFERLNREGSPVDDTIAHAWKISYHSVRSMIQTVKRLNMMLDK